MAPPKTPNSPRGTVRGASSHSIVNFTIRASPLPRPILDFVLQNLVVLKKIQHDREAGDKQSQGQDDAEDQDGVDDYGDIIRKPSVKPEQFWSVLQDKCREVGGEWESITDRIWAFGPQKAGGCLLIDSRKTAPFSYVFLACHVS